MNIRLPQFAQELFTPCRYKVLYGGRGSGKSWTFANVALIRGRKEPLTILCCRDHLNSLDGSVYTLLCNLIEEHGWQNFYTIQSNVIKGANGTIFKFKGLEKNTLDVKSFEGADICWIEEAVTVSNNVWSVLTPTIRKTGSEIWISFNPELDTDDTYKRFVLYPPSGSIVRKLSYKDNPYFNDIMLTELNDCKARDYDEYLNVWEGHCKQSVTGAVYANEMRNAMTQGRITKVPYEPCSPVHTFWDIGFADHTAIWFAQYIGFEIHIIDYVQDRLQELDFYLKKLKEKNYLYGTAYLPHDARHKTIGNAGISIEDKVRRAGYTVEASKYAERKGIQIQAVRNVITKCYFDEANCADGLNALRRFKYKVDPNTGQYSKEPMHDHNSHGADAFAQLAVRMKPKKNINRSTSYNTDYEL